MPHGVTPFEIEKYLGGAEYPIPKDRLAQIAEENGASEEVIETIHRLPADTIESPQELSSFFGDVAMDEDESNRNFDESLGEIGAEDEKEHFHIER